MEEPRIVGGSVALDLVNTVAPRPATAEATDWLDSPSALLHWACRVGLISEAEAEGVSSAWAAEPASAVTAWHSAVDIREALYAVLSAALGASQPADGAVAELERLALRWSAATARSSLRLGGPGEPPAVLTDGAGALLIPDRLAHAAVEFTRTADLSQLRACPVAEGGCGWLFLDRSRNHSRRWCAMEDCGTQAKSRRLTTRRRTDRTRAAVPHRVRTTGVGN
ncbi:MAG TPA: CGNR zinc finger domain-containing protein [Micromonosporaceae bacterium]|jgi:predicted RNA-binding Zn ribbon-like protein|nr:CGNR zinc finger domain-containing protein [Micromonosporaceae bacterium]